MNRLTEKLKNEDGASLLLSLLVFLLCVMVAASVLAAAASNAGKARSSRAEQQRYQTLSSALRLICGELEKVEYTGKYKVYTWNAGGTDYFYCEQQNSEKIAMQSTYNGQTFRITDFAFMDGVLNREMDDVFRRQFQKKDGSGDAEKGYGPLPDSGVLTADQAAAAPIRLTVTLPDGLAGYPYAAGSRPFEEYEIPKTTNVEIKLNHKTGGMELTAWLDDSGASSPPSGSGVMVAELTVDTDYKPVIPDSAEPASVSTAADIPPAAMVSDNRVSVKWKLNSMSMTTAP